MPYLNNNFWRMVVGLVVVLIMGIAFLVICQIYNLDNVSPENYVAG